MVNAFWSRVIFAIKCSVKINIKTVVNYSGLRKKSVAFFYISMPQFATLHIMSALSRLVFFLKCFTISQIIKAGFCSKDGKSVFSHIYIFVYMCAYELYISSVWNDFSLRVFLAPSRRFVISHENKKYQVHRLLPTFQHLIERTRF